MRVPLSLVRKSRPSTSIFYRMNPRMNELIKERGEIRRATRGERNGVARGVRRARRKREMQEDGAISLAMKRMERQARSREK